MIQRYSLKVKQTMPQDEIQYFRPANVLWSRMIQTMFETYGRAMANNSSRQDYV